MKIYISLALFCCSLLSVGATEKKVKSEIKEVTVFLNGAQVKRTASAQLEAGRNELHFQGLPLSLDQKSLQFSANAPITILSINYQISYIDETVADSAKIFKLEQDLKTLRNEIKTVDFTRNVYHQEKQVLMNNSRFGGTENGTSVLELEKGVNLIRTRLLELNTKMQDLEGKKDELNLKSQKILNRLEEYRRKSAVKTGEVIVMLNADQKVNANLNLTYTVSQASWKPYYDLRVKNVSQPLELIYKAKVVQNTGENWDKVKIKLSTGDPSQTGQFPALLPWFLNFTNGRYSQTSKPKNYNNPGIKGQISGIVTDSKTGEAIAFANVVAKNASGEIILGTTSNFDGKFLLDLKRPANQIQTSFLGYNNHSQALNASNRFYRISLYEAQERLEEVIVSYDNIVDKRAIEMSSTNIPQASIQNITPIATSGLSAQYGDASGGVVNIRGARSEGTAYFIDGVKIRGKSSINQQFIISRNPTTLNFSVSEPYTIPADGNDYLVTLQEYSLPADYTYRASPKLEEFAYLTAGINEWEQLSLRSGSAGIYYEGTYMGETYLDVDNAGDTLEISLGKDENISIKREAIQSKESTRFISNNKEEDFHYRIGIRNNKQNAVNLIIYDQYPISANDKIKVKQLDNSEGKLDEESGIIEWKMEIKPSVEREINLKYKITYPKNTTINIY